MDHPGMMIHRNRFSITAASVALAASVARFALLAAACLGFAASSVGQGAGTALVRHAPDFKGGAIEGSLQMMLGENVTLDGGVEFTRDLLVPGMPTVRVKGKPSFSGTLDGTGAASPTGYQITLVGKTSLQNVVRRTDPVTLASVAAPRTPAGTSTVVLAAGQPAPDFATLLNLTLAEGAGQVALPPGAYGDFTANAGTGFTLGIAQATQPALYDFSRLTLAAGSQLQVVGPIVITVGSTIVANGVIGSSAQTGWVTLNIATGGLTLGNGASFDGYVNAPAGTVSMGGKSRLTGGLIADRLAMAAQSVLRLQVPPVPAANVPPTVALTAPAEGTLYTAPATIFLAATASDADGTIAKVEFFQGANKIGEALGRPFEFSWVNVPPGAYALTARAHDNAGASATSAARTVTVQLGLPYFTGFEASDGYVAGPLAGQIGWTVTGAATVIESGSYAGTRTVAVGGAGAAAQARHGFPSYASQTLVFVDVFSKPAAGTSLASSVVVQAGLAQVALVRTGDSGELVAWSGNGVGAGSWVATGFKVPLAPDGSTASWLRLTLREDFAAKRWDLYANGRLVMCDAGFTDNTATSLAHVTLGGPDHAGSLFDEFFAGFEHPLFIDADRDGMDDAWESQQGLNPLIDDRNGDLDGDGVTNIQEYRHGTRPSLADTDGDGLPDGWEILHGLSPTQPASATEDSDGDGLTDRQEFAAGTNPRSPDTDGDGMPDGWETSYGFNPTQPADAAADADGDGKSNLLEYQTGTNPNEYYNGILPQLVALVGGNRRPGINGLVGVRVTRLDGTLLINAPISFEAISGGILVSTATMGTNPATLVSVRSDAQGIAAVYVQYPSPAAPLSTLVAIAQSGSQTQTLSISLAPPIVDFDGDGLDDGWEQKYFGGLHYAAGEDPGAIGRTLAQSHFDDLNPWPAAVVSSGLQLWYRAELGVLKDATDKVSRWADLSGNAVHVAQTDAAAQPLAVSAALGGKPAVRFDGLATTLRTSAAVDLLQGSSDATVMVVVRPGATQAIYADIMDYNHGTPPYGGFALQQNENALNQYGFGWRAPDNGSWIGLSSTVQLGSAAPQLLSFLKGGATQRGYLNGGPVFSAGVPAEMLGNTPRLFSLGSFVADNSRYFNGEIAEVLFYNRALTPAERTQIEEACGVRYFDTDADGLSDLWEMAKLGTLSYGAQDDPGGVGRTLLASQQQGLLPWPAATVAAGLQAWYRADLGVAVDATNRVSRWTDVSGNGVHALQSAAAAQPLATPAAMGHQPAIRFNGSTTALRSGLAELLQGGADITIIAVIRPAATQASYADILDYNHATSPYGGFVLQQNGDGLNQYGLGWRSPNNGGWEGLAPTVNATAGAVQFLTVVKSGATQSGYLNGEQKFSASLSAQMLVNAPRALIIGNFGATGDRPFNGDIAEVLIYNRALSSSERLQAEAALAQKYTP